MAYFPPVSLVVLVGCVVWGGVPAALGCPSLITGVLVCAFSIWVRGSHPGNIQVTVLCVFNCLFVNKDMVF